MNAVILDTETNTLHGLPIQIAYVPCALAQGVLNLNINAVYDQLFACGEPIVYAAMAVNHIIESDLVGKPSYKSFSVPKDVVYMIGHNIQYDIDTIARCGVDVSRFKPICTLALSRHVFPNAPAHNISALSYMLSTDQSKTRDKLKNAHNAKADILLTADILGHIIHALNTQCLEDLYQASLSALVPSHMTFGKHKGTALYNLPEDYVAWLLRQDDLDKNLRKGLKNRKQGFKS